MLFIIRTSLSVEDPTLRREVYLDSLCSILSGVRCFLGPVALRESPEHLSVPRRGARLGQIEPLVRIIG